MIKGITRSFEIPKEMRAVAEQSVEQAKLAFNNYLQRLRKPFPPSISGSRQARSARRASATRR